jgi:hypothetical protein
MCGVFPLTVLQIDERQNKAKRILQDAQCAVLNDGYITVARPNSNNLLHTMGHVDVW